MSYFHLSEFTKSERSEELGIDNTPTDAAKGNILKLTRFVLDPLREWYGKPIHINSGYRCPALNKVTPGSSETSQHMTGQAADITAGSVEENKKLFDYIRSNLLFDQVIWEKGGRWVHVSYKNINNRKQVLYK